MVEESSNRGKSPDFSHLYYFFFSSPFKIVSATKRLASIHKPMSGINIINITLYPSIFASKISDSNTAEPASPICQLPSRTCVRSGEGTLPLSAAYVTAYCRAVDIETPTTAPTARSRLRVVVATARSSLLERACTATRPSHVY